MTRSLLLTGSQIFASEITEARRLGFQLQVMVSEPGIAAARLTPQTERALQLCKQNDGAGAIEATCAVEDEANRLDITRDTIRTALQMARDAGA